MQPTGRGQLVLTNKGVLGITTARESKGGFFVALVGRGAPTWMYASDLRRVES